MSYINKQSTTLVRTKLTDIGREQLAKGQLTFNNYIIGDSEVDYNYIKGWSEFVPSSSASTGEFLFHEANDNVVQNIFGFTNPEYISNISGKLYYMNFKINFK